MRASIEEQTADGEWLPSFPLAPPSRQRVATVSNGQRMWRDNLQNGLEITTPRSTPVYIYIFFFINIVIISTCGISTFDCSVRNTFRNLAHHFPYYAVRITISKNCRLKCQLTVNTFTAIVDLSRFNNSCLKSPASTLVDLTFQSHALRSFSLNQLCNLSL